MWKMGRFWKTGRFWNLENGKWDGSNFQFYFNIN